MRADEAPVVGHDDQRAAAFFLLFAQELEDLVAALAVEVSGGLVGEQDDRVLDQGAGDRHPLLLAAGELRRLVAQADARARPGLSKSSALVRISSESAQRV